MAVVYGVQVRRAVEASLRLSEDAAATAEARLGPLGTEAREGLVKRTARRPRAAPGRRPPFGPPPRLERLRCRHERAGEGVSEGRHGAVSSRSPRTGAWRWHRGVAPGVLRPRSSVGEGAQREERVTRADSSEPAADTAPSGRVGGRQRRRLQARREGVELPHGEGVVVEARGQGPVLGRQRGAGCLARGGVLHHPRGRGVPHGGRGRLQAGRELR
jgi:hypothetical protein